MAGDGSFLVEEFINAITSQLDRVQDALRIKAVNRPLTYALKDLALELKVFVEMDEQGNVRFRTSGPNEAGASVVHLGFTTITKPMIEENTISLATTRSASLEELGLSTEERQRLERVGVRNLAQLSRLGSSTGVQTVARLSDVPVDRLKRALTLGRPKVSAVKPEPPRTPRQPSRPPRAEVPVDIRPEPPLSAKPPPPAPRLPRSPDVRSVPGFVSQPSPAVRVVPGTRRLQLTGAHLMGEDGPPTVRLNDQTLGIVEADDDRLVVEMPEELESGSLEVRLPGGDVLMYDLSVAAPQDDEGYDLWAPNGEHA